MDCSDVRRLLSREIDGELDPSRLKELEAHLERCESCRRAREDLRETYALHRRLGEIEPPLTLVPEIMTAVEGPQRRSRFTGFFRAAVPIAAAVVLILGIYAGVFLSGLHETTGVDQQLAALELEFLDSYPPGSMGDLLMEATEGGDDDGE